MTLGELKNHFLKMEAKKELSFRLSDPFSWRGVYAECAFSILKEVSTKEENLEKIEKALSEEFEGYKGGEFKYNSDTDIHFEADAGSYTDGGYSEEIVEEIKGIKPYNSIEQILVECAFM